jgi:hypothetical protein
VIMQLSINAGERLFELNEYSDLSNNEYVVS